MLNKEKESVVSIMRSQNEAHGYGLSALFRKEDFDKIEKYWNDIKQNKGDSKYLEMFCQNLEDKYNDRRSGRINKDFPEPINASLDKNALTTEGIRLTNENITGQDATRFNWMCSGRGNSIKPTMFSDFLEDENARMSIESQGWFFARGTTLVQGCKFIDSITSATIVEFGSANVGDPDEFGHTLWWRNRIVSPSQYIEHRQYETVYIHVHIIDIRSVSE